MNTVNSHLIDPLEARIAPAGITLLNLTTLTYDDVEGDHVTVKISKPLFTNGNIGVVGGDLGAVRIGHDILGGSMNGSASAEDSGISASGRIASITIGGSIFSGMDENGSPVENATIRAQADIGALTVKGGVVGHGPG